MLINTCLKGFWRMLQGIRWWNTTVLKHHQAAWGHLKSLHAVNNFLLHYLLQVFTEFKSARFQLTEARLCVQPLGLYLSCPKSAEGVPCQTAAMGPGHSSASQGSSSISSRDDTEQHFNLSTQSWRHPGWEQCNNEHLLLLNEHSASSTLTTKGLGNIIPSFPLGCMLPSASCKPGSTGWHRKVQRNVVISAGRADTHIKKCAATTQNV